jgi:type I restriction enzyme S subunit
MEELAAPSSSSLAIGPFGSSLKVSDYRTNGVPLVFVRNIRANQFGKGSTNYISEPKAIQLKAHVVHPGDVLITKMGDPPGDTCLYPRSEPDGVVTADCIKLTPNPTLVTSLYLMYAIRSPSVHTQVLLQTRGVAQRKLSLERFRRIVSPLAPLAEQQRIVAAIEEHLSRIDAAVTGLERVRAQLPSYRAAVLKAACEGKFRQTTSSRVVSVSGSERLAQETEGGSSGLAALPPGWRWMALRDLAQLKGGLTKGQKRRSKTPVRSVPYLRVAMSSVASST